MVLDGPTAMCVCEIRGGYITFLCKDVSHLLLGSVLKEKSHWDGGLIVNNLIVKSVIN